MVPSLNSVGALVLISLAVASPAAGQAPSNDSCSTALPLVDGATAFTTAGATTDGPAHPTCPGLVFGDDLLHRDVWFVYQASCSGTLRLTTCEELGGSSTFDTRLAIYQPGSVCPIGGLDLISCNDDDPVNNCGTQAGGWHSTLEVPVNAGDVHYIRIGGFGEADFGSGSLLVECSGGGAAEWVRFIDGTSRLVSTPSVGVADVAEKDYIWGDVDQDGDEDLISVRKQPWNTPGRRRNVLFMNEGIVDGQATDGVLVDRTTEFATAADDGGQGFLDATADRDVALIDVNDDGWLDVITSTTYGDGLPKEISHPRVYVNQKEIDGVWQGFRYEQGRTPTMPIAPNFCGIGFGDVNGDASPDLYFVEYNNDLEDRLWINDGLGFFDDQSELRLSPQMRESDFGVHSVIVDLNGDGVNDIVKDRGSTTSTPPLRISAIYNDPGNEGFFDVIETVYNGSPYHVEVGELNNDGLPDLIVEDDGSDRYFLNQGNGGDGLADFVGRTFAPSPDSFGGNIVIRDLDLDGFNDVLIADVDVDCCGCTRVMRMYHNLGDVPDVTFESEDGGIPATARRGTHDIAVFDIDRDGLPDLVIGTCTGTSVWIQQPPSGLSFSYPMPRPLAAASNGSTTFRVRIEGSGSSASVPGSALLHYTVGGGAPGSVLLNDLGDGQFEGQLPAAPCRDEIDWYLSAQATTGGIFHSPANAPAATWTTIAADGLRTVFADSFEGSVAGWTVESYSLTGGGWEQAIPNPTLTPTGDLAAPDGDAEDEAGHEQAFVTENGPPGGGAGASDLDGGPARLISPAFDLSGSDGIVSFKRWFYTSGNAVLQVWVSPGSGRWVPVALGAGSDGEWQDASFRVGAHVDTTATMRVRFDVLDFAPGEITEAGIDGFRVERIRCGTRVFPASPVRRP